MSKETKEALEELAIQIARLMEDQCGNSGLNWLDSFKEIYLK